MLSGFGLFLLVLPAREVKIGGVEKGVKVEVAGVVVDGKPGKVQE
jgi:hypothetical protein